MAKYGSGSKKVTPNAGLRTSRYQYLTLEDAEPNLGFTTEKVLPLKSNYYQLVSFDGGTVYDRYWQVAPAGIITGISIFDEGLIVGTGNSINKIDFRGNIITATANNFGTISTITVAPPGSDSQLIYNSGGNFAASANLTFSSNTLFVTGLGSFSQGSYNQYVRVGVASNNIIDTISGNLVLDANSGITSIKSILLAGITTFSGSNSSNLVTLSQTGTGNALFANGTVISGLGSIGVGTTVPTQELDVNGDIRLRGTIYDYYNQPGANNNILIKNSLGGVEWVSQSTVQTGAAGTYTNVQYQTYAGAMGGASNFVYDPISSRVGIGSTQPQYLLDVLGYSRFTGQTEISNLRVTGVTTVGFLTGTNAYFSGVITATTFNGNATSASYASTSGVSTSVIGGIASISQLNVSGISTLASLGVIGLTTTQNFKVTGVSTVGFITASNLYVSGVSTLGGAKIKNINVGTTDDNTISTPTGNLTLDSFSGTTVIKDILSINDTTQTTSITDGALVVGGGAGIKNDLNVGGYIAIAGTFGVTGTSYPKQLIASGIASFTNTTESTNKDNGSVIVEGGVGIEKNLNVGGASSISGIVTFGSNILPFNNLTQDIGSSSQKWNSVWATTFNGKFLGNADTAGYATTAGMSTNLVGGSAGLIPYQSGNNQTSFIQVGTANSLLQSNGTSAPTWINPGILNVAYASSAGISTNIKGGSAGVIPYQNNTGITSFTQVGSANSLLQSNGTSAPTWIDPGTLKVAYASSAGISTNLAGIGITGAIPYQSGDNQTSFTQVGTAGSLLQSNGISAPTWVQPSGLSVKFAGYATTAGLSTNIKGGAAGAIPWQVGIDSTGFTQVGTAGSLLQSNGINAPTWISPLGLFVQNAGYASTSGIATYATSAGYASTSGIATYATSAGISTYATKAGLSTNLVSVGATGQVPYQSSDNTTSFTSGGIGGNLLQYNGLSGPIWASPQGLTIGYAITAGISSYATNTGVATYATKAGLSTNLVSVNSNGQVPYQSADNTTSFTSGGTANSSLLQYGGNSGPKWVLPSDLAIPNTGYATTAGISTNIKGGSSGQIVYQSALNATSFVQVGAAGSILVGDGTNGPKWINPSVGFNVDRANYANSSGVSTNLANGSSGQIPYQTGSNQTGFIPIGAANSLLQSNGSNIPSWVSPSNLTISYASTAGVATNIKGGNAGSIPYQSGPDTTTFLQATPFNGQLLQYNTASNSPIWVSPLNVTVQNANYASEAGVTTNLKGGTAGQVAYQYLVGISSFTTGGTANSSLLQYGGNSGPKWVLPSDLAIPNAGYATTAGISTNIKGGNVNQIVYQSTTDKTAFIPVGLAGSILSSNGTSSPPTWINPSLGFNVDTANYAMKSGTAVYIEGGSIGALLYQQQIGVTAFIPVGAAGSVLASKGPFAAPEWINPTASGSKPIVSNDVSNVDRYLTFVGGNSNVQDLYVDSSDLKYNPSSNKITVPRLYATTALGVGTDPASFASGEIRTTNNITAYVASDINLKTNIKPISDPIKKLSQINGVSFDWKDDYIAERGGEDGYFVRKHDIGVIAQEIEKVLPEIVVSRENGTKAIKYELLAPLLIEAIKEQQKTILNLQKRIESLEK